MAQKPITNQDANGLSWAFANDLKAQLSKPLPKTLEAARIFEHVRDHWPNSNPMYWRNVTRRWLCYETMPADDAIKAIRLGYTSPSAAISARVIRRRKMTRTLESF